MTGKEALEELFKRVKNLEKAVYNKDIIELFEVNDLTFNGIALSKKEKLIIKVFIKTTLDMVRNNHEIFKNIPEFKD
jgi:hypothetical protein